MRHLNLMAGGEPIDPNQLVGDGPVRVDPQTGAIVLMPLLVPQPPPELEPGEG